MDAKRFVRTFEVLELLASDRQNGLRLTDISRSLDSPVSSTYNLLKALLTAEMVVVDDDLRYHVGPRAVRLGIKITASLKVRVTARRWLEALAKSLGTDVYLAIPLGERVVYTDRFPGSEAISLDIRLGDPLSLYATAVGKLFAAHVPELRKRTLTGRRPRLTEATIVDKADLVVELEAIRASGVSISREEAVEGILGIAVPIRDASGELVAAVHVSAVRAGVSPAREKKLVDQSRVTASLVEDDLGFREAAEGQRRAMTSDVPSG